MPDLDQAVRSTPKHWGFPEAIRNVDDKGKPALVYVQISKDTFLDLELSPESLHRQATERWK